MSTPIAKSALFKVWALLIALAVINIALAFLPIGAWSWTIAYPIAALMALLIMIFFMHLHESTTLIRIFAVAGFFWLMLLFSISMADYLTRAYIYLP
jgi:cytochrome c oxidase subunit IV